MSEQNELKILQIMKNFSLSLVLSIVKTKDIIMNLFFFVCSTGQYIFIL